MTSNYDDIYIKIKSIIAQQLNINQNNIADNSTLDSLGLDSIDRAELVMKIEEEFGIEINDEEAERLNTVEQAAKYVANLV